MSQQEPDVPLGRQSRDQRRAAETVALNRDQLAQLRDQAGAPPAGPTPTGAVPPASAPPVADGTAASAGLGRGAVIVLAALAAVIVVALLVVVLA